MPEFDEKKIAPNERSKSPEELAEEEKRAIALEKNYGQTKELGPGSSTENLKRLIHGEKRLGPEKVEPDFQFHGNQIHPDLERTNATVNIYMRNNPPVGYTIGFETQTIPDDAPWLKGIDGKVIQGLGHSAALKWLREKTKQLSEEYKRKQSDTARADELRKDLRS